MKLYKLTDNKGQTLGGTQWGEGVTHTAPGIGPLCTAGWIHAYTDPLLAILLNPIHANFEDPQLWEAEGEVGIDDHGLKVGSRSVTTTHRIPLPNVSTVQRVAFGILCALEVDSFPSNREWAEEWLDGSNRSRAAADAAYAAARAAADAATDAADAAARAAAAYAADAAAYAADAAAYATARTAAACAAYAAAYAAARAAARTATDAARAAARAAAHAATDAARAAADAAAYAADAAVYAARAAAHAIGTPACARAIDLVALARKAMAVSP